MSMHITISSSCVVTTHLGDRKRGAIKARISAHSTTNIAQLLPFKFIHNIYLKSKERIVKKIRENIGEYVTF